MVNSYIDEEKNILRLSNFPQISQLARGRAGVQGQVMWQKGQVACSFYCDNFASQILDAGKLGGHCYTVGSGNELQQWQ